MKNLASVFVCEGFVVYMCVLACMLPWGEHREKERKGEKEEVGRGGESWEGEREE